MSKIDRQYLQFMIPCLVLFLCMGATGVAHAIVPLKRALPPWIVAQGYSANRMITLGYLPVNLYDGYSPDGGTTTFPLKNDGSTDSLAALQQAVNDARDYHMVALIPSGTYIVSDTLKGMMKVTSFVNNQGVTKYRNAWRTSVAIVGSTLGSRPVIKLQDNAAGFSGTTPKAVIHMWSQCTGNEQHCTNPGTLNPADEQPNVAFNQLLKNIEVDCGSGNTQAVGVWNNAAQGSSIEHVKVVATGAFAGFYNLPSRVSGAIDIAVEGGEYGLYIPSAMHPVVVGLTLHNQTTAAIYSKGFAPVTVVGFDFVKSSAPMVTTPMNYLAGAASATLNLVDGKIELQTAGGIAFDNTRGRNLSLYNVFVKGADTLVKSGAAAPLLADSNRWSRIKHYSYADKTVYPVKNQTFMQETFNLINGVIDQGQHSVVTVLPIADVGAGAEAVSLPPSDLIARHLPPHSISPEDPDVKVVTDADMGAKGDGVTDDTAALQRAINTYDKVFIPKGEYLLTDTLLLRSTTQLSGLTHTYTELIPNMPTWCPTTETPVIDTVADANGTTFLSDIWVATDISKQTCNYFNPIRWRVGRNSAVVGIQVKHIGWTPHFDTNSRRAVVIENTGGGRWYFLDAGSPKGVKNIDYRILAVINNTEPLTIYGLNPEHAQGSPFIELNGASNVHVFGVKTELTHVTTGVTPDFDMMHIINSDNIMVFGHAQAGATEQGRALYRITDSTNVLLTNIVPIRGGTTGFSVIEDRAGVMTSIAGNNNVAQYRRGEATRPWASISHQALSFIASSSVPLPATQNVTVSNTGDGIFTWSLNCPEAWMTCSITNSAVPGEFSVSIIPGQLVAGVYQGVVQFTADQAFNGRIKIPVTLTLEQGVTNPSVIICDDGYEKVNEICTDIDECALALDNCSADGDCTNVAGGFACTCNSEFTGDGVTCVANEPPVWGGPSETSDVEAVGMGQKSPQGCGCESAGAESNFFFLFLLLFGVMLVRAKDPLGLLSSSAKDPLGL